MRNITFYERKKKASRSLYSRVPSASIVKINIQHRAAVSENVAICLRAFNLSELCCFSFVT